MPIATKNNTIMDESEVHPTMSEMIASQSSLTSIRIPGEILDELLQLISTMEKFQRQDKDNKAKIDILRKFNDAAKESIKNAEGKRDTLQKIVMALKVRLDDSVQKVKEAHEAWINDHGIDVKQISNDSDDFKYYEITYSKLPTPKRLQKLLDPTQPNDLNPNATQSENNDDKTTSEASNPNTTQTNATKDINSQPILLPGNNFIYKIGLKEQDKALTIVSQQPEILRPDEITNFNEDLTKTCVCPETFKVDYKLAVLKIKMCVVKNP